MGTQAFAVFAVFAMGFSGSKRVSWRRGEVFPTECVTSYPMVGRSPIFRPEKRNSVFSLLWATLLGNSAVFLFQGSRESVRLASRRSEEVRGSLELQNGGLRALKVAWMMIVRLRHFPVKFGRFLWFFGHVQGWPREVWQGAGAWQELGRSFYLWMAGFWMQQVKLS